MAQVLYVDFSTTPKESCIFSKLVRIRILITKTAPAGVSTLVLLYQKINHKIDGKFTIHPGISFHPNLNEFYLLKIK